MKKKPFFGTPSVLVTNGLPSIAGISGGRTSARMAYLLPKSTVLSFQNTGREHPKTYDFLEAVEQDIQRSITRLEWHAPPRGEPPRNARVVETPHKELRRRGEPFRDLLECLAAYRKKEKGKGPIAPWARQRICTAYLKIKSQRAYCLSRGWGEDGYVQFVGLRVDEPDRVALMRARNDLRRTDERAPLFDLGITKEDVLAFWKKKPFDLEIPEHLGNCTGCFLKDERDLADALLDPNTDAAWWLAIEADFAPMRRQRPSYAQVLAEAPERLRIREALAKGATPVSALPPVRHRLVVRQEQAPREAWSCGCAAAESLTDEAVLDV